MNRPTNEEFATEVVTALESSLDNKAVDDQALDEHFAQMRANALRHIPLQASRTGRSYSLIGIGLASTAVLLLMALWLVNPPTAPSSDAQFALNELDILTEGEDLDMLEEEGLEFYVWLEAELEAG